MREIHKTVELNGLSQKQLEDFLLGKMSFEEAYEISPGDDVEIFIDPLHTARQN